MSFDVGPTMKNLSNVQASAKTCSGGGGNTGYFSRGGDDENIGFSFAKDYPADSFEKADFKVYEDDESLWEFIKNWFIGIVAKIVKKFQSLSKRRV